MFRMRRSGRTQEHCLVWKFIRPTRWPLQLLQRVRLSSLRQTLRHPPLKSCDSDHISDRKPPWRDVFCLRITRVCTRSARDRK